MIVRAAISPTFASWRARARELLRDDIPPSRVLWTDGTQESLFGRDLAPETSLVSQPRASTMSPETCPDGQVNYGSAMSPETCPDGRIPHASAVSPEASPAGQPKTATPNQTPRVPAELLALAEVAAYHRDPERWSLLYRVLYRIVHGEPELLARVTDPDVVALRARVQAVRRDEHKMHAFVRFRRTEGPDGEHFIAWHRPDHPLLPLAAPFFARRFADMRWSIVTPDASAHWDRETLTFGPGAPQHTAPRPDELEDLFRTYYRNIFNPARLNLRAMRAEMPRKHWATLPEANIIAELTREAPQRTQQMLDAPASAAATFLPAVRTLPVLREAAANCTACEICRSATQTIFGEGPAGARLMLVGEQPGDEEDRSGKPFIGPAGQLLDQLLVEAGIDRSQVYVTNAVKHFKWTPRGKKRLHARPHASEVQACRAWLDAEIEAVRPTVIVCLGSTAARSFLGPRFNAARGRGKVHRTPWAPVWLATYHPSAALRSLTPADRERALAGLRQDLRLAAEQLQLHALAPPVAEAVHRITGT